MKVASYVECIRSDGRALAEAARGKLDAPVPSCPGWSVADLLTHTGGVHRFWTAAVTVPFRSRDDARAWAEPEPPSSEALVDWFAEGVDELVNAISSVDPDSPSWNWSSTQPQTAAWVPRRMAHETSIHRWDAQNAAGSARPIDSDLAADGVDEFLDVFLPDQSGAPAGEGGTIHLHRTDGPGEWFLRIGGDGVEVTREHARGDAAVRAPASDLVLLLWRRIAPADVEVLGDGAVLDRFASWVDLS